MTKEERVLKALKELHSRTHRLAKIFKDAGDETTSRTYVAEATIYQEAIWLLTDEKFLDFVENNNKAYFTE